MPISLKTVLNIHEGSLEIEEMAAASLSLDGRWHGGSHWCKLPRPPYNTQDIIHQRQQQQGDLTYKKQ